MFNFISDLDFTLRDSDRFLRFHFFLFEVNCSRCSQKTVALFNRAFHGFGEAEFPDGGSVLGSSQFSILPPVALKNTPGVKSGQNRPKNNHLAMLI